MSSEQILFFRRCHLCGSVSHREGAAVERCVSCDKSLSHFYYFEDRRAEIYSESPPSRTADGLGTALVLAERTFQMPVRGRSPGPTRTLRGFTAVW